MLELNLQLFAGEKTERATPRRRREVREEGRIPKSVELTSSITLLAALLALRFLGPGLWNQWYVAMQSGLVDFNASALTTTQVVSMFVDRTWLMVRMSAPILLILMVTGVTVSYAQIGPQFVPRLLLPDFSRINPLAGVRRMFSMRTLVELLKSMVKLLIVGVPSYLSASSMVKQMASLQGVDIIALPRVVGGMVFQLGILIAIMMVILAIADYLYQRFDFEKSIRMSKQDIRDEMKREEGDAGVKHRIRARGREMIMRMMQQVPKADVVVTNPTHYAIAIQYDVSKMSAPVVIAKGADEVARRIREAATEHGIPTVENKPLAQGLYRSTDIGQQVPAEFYQAVAELLAYVYRLKNQIFDRQ